MTFYTKPVAGVLQSGVFGGGVGSGGEMPEVEEFLSSTPYVHWGYLNSTQIVVKGKKIKKEKWTTLWLELCGSTLKLFKDSSLHVESASFPPPTSFILARNESKVAFLELRNSEVSIFSNARFSEMSRKNVSKTVSKKNSNSSAPSVYRRHMFELKCKDLRTTFVFQAPSRTAMLRWVQKIEESLDALNDPTSDLAKEGVNLAQQIMEVKLKAQKKYALEENDGLDDLSIMSDLPTGKPVQHPKLLDMKEKLFLKKELQWQVETQIIDFMGRGKGDFKRDEFVCTTNQDYFLVPGRVETFIPCGTNVTVFGQLPNGRWRCLVETKDLLSAIRQLVKEIKGGSIATVDAKGEQVISKSRNIGSLMNILNNEPDYPILGCLPTSVLDFESAGDADVVSELAPRKSVKKPKMAYTVTITPSPVASVTTIPAVETCYNPKAVAHDKDELVVIGDLKISDLDDLSPYHSDSDSDEEQRTASFDKNVVENVKLRNFGEGIVIRNKLRQKGISILVGDSSSEDEVGEEGEEGS